MNAPLTLEVRGVSKRFPGVRALDRVDLDVRYGEVHVLLGENGAGKSTLMKILSGAYARDEGQILIDGQPVEPRDPKHARELGISIIYQTFSQAPHLSVAENLFLGREPLTAFGTIDRKRLAAISRDALARLGLSLNPAAIINDLSVSARQLVEIAKALTLEARIVIMDEPTSALSERETSRLFEVIDSLTRAGVAIVYISHRLEEVRRIGDRVTVLRDGRKVGTRRVADVDVDTLVNMMVGRDLALSEVHAAPPEGPEVLRVRIDRAGRLHDIDVRLSKGEIVGLAGLVGSGRTALARAIFGIDPTARGQVWVDGQPVHIAHPSAATKLGIGFLTEDRLHDGLAMSLSVGDNATLASLRQFELFRLPVLNLRRARTAARAYMAEMNVQARSVEQKVRFLSGGNQQKVVLAKWLMARSRILLLDEPTQGIDIGAKEEVHRLIIDFTRRRGGTVLLISSDLPELLRMSDRVLVMHRGGISGELRGRQATHERVMHLAVGTGADARSNR